MMAMSSKDSLDKLVAFEEEAANARQQPEAPAPPLPQLSQKVWGALTAQFRVPPTFVMRWNALAIKRRKRVRRLLALLAVTIVAGAGYFASTLPTVRTRVTAGWQRVELAFTPYVAQARGLFAGEEAPPPATEPEGVAAGAAQAAVGQVEGVSGPAKRHRSRAQKKEASHRPGKTKRPGKGPNGQKSGPRARKLTRDVIVATVRKQMSSLVPCIKRARVAGEIVPGRHTFVLDWVVEPGGAVSRPSLKGPAAVLRSSLPACFAAQMGGWKFPRTGERTPVSRFPLPVTVP
jgi:hypothetical protein